jgi:ribosomal protein L11
MKKVTLDLMLGKKTRCLYKKKTQKTIIIKANLPAGAATKSPPLGSILGQYGLNATEFCDLFNKNSLLLWKMHQIIPIVIFISPAKTYLIEYKLPTVYTLLDTVFRFKTKRYTFFHQSQNIKKLVATAYKIALIQGQTCHPVMVYKLIHQILGSFRSYNLFSSLRLLKVKFNFRKKKNK